MVPFIKMMTTNKKVILISENEELYKSLKRAFRYIKGIEISKMEAREKQPDIFLIYTYERDSLYKWLWNDLRIQKGYKSPVIALGYHKLDSSIDLRDKVFEKEFKSHRYFQIPFDLREMLEETDVLIPLKNITQAVKDYANPSGIISIAFHDLWGLFKGGGIPDDEKKEKICRILYQMKEPAKIMGVKNTIISFIEDTISQIKQSQCLDEKWYDALKNKFTEEDIYE